MTVRMGVQRRFARDLGAVAQIRTFVDEFVETEDAGSAAFALNLALEELFVNMVHHNSGGTSDIQIALAREGHRLLVTMTDDDSALYDITRHESVDVDVPLADREPGGLGIHLVHRFMDEVHYEHQHLQTTIRLVKLLPDKDAAH